MSCELNDCVEEFKEEKENGTQFIWKIENFSCLNEEILTSPDFSSHSVKWEVEICNSLSKDPEMISISLHVKYNSGEIFSIPHEMFSCSLAFVDSDGIPLNWSERKFMYRKDRQHCNKITVVTFGKFIKKNEMFGSKKRTFLPNNTLTVQCLIWQTSEELVLPMKCFGLTRIEPKTVNVEKTFDWNIENVSTFTESQTRVEEIGIKFAFISICLSVSVNGELEVTFSSSLFRSNLKVKIYVLNAMGKTIPLLNEETHWNKKKTFQTYITKTMLTFHNNLLLNQDTLTLRFICTISTNITFHRTVTENEINVNNSQSTAAPSLISEPSECVDKPQSKNTSTSHSPDFILKVLQDMYEGFLSDCILKIRSREPPFDKCEHGVDMDDVTLQRLLNFVISGRVEENMNWEDALKLYAAAHSYSLESLQRKCSADLRSRVCVSSVLDVLKWAEMHQDENLKSAAMDFISCNDKEVVGSPSWLSFEQDNATLAAEALRKLYLKKING